MRFFAVAILARAAPVFSFSDRFSLFRSSLTGAMMERKKEAVTVFGLAMWGGSIDKFRKVMNGPDQPQMSMFDQKGDVEALCMPSATVLRRDVLKPVCLLLFSRNGWDTPIFISHSIHMRTCSHVWISPQQISSTN